MQKPLQITFKDLEHSDTLEALVRERVERLERFHPAIIGCRVVVETPHRSAEGTSPPLGLTVEVEIPGRPKIVAKASGDGKKAANWVTQEVMRVLNENGWTLAQFPLTAAVLGELVKLVIGGEVEITRAKEVFNDMVASKRSAAESMQALGISKVDTGELEAICKEIVAANPKIVADVKGGKQQAVGALVGQAKKKNPNANPNDVRRICLEIIEKM